MENLPSFLVNTIKIVDFPASYVSLQECNPNKTNPKKNKKKANHGMKSKMGVSPIGSVPFKHSHVYPFSTSMIMGEKVIRTKPWKSKTKQRMVFRMIHVKDSLLPMGKVWSLDFLGKHFPKKNLPNYPRTTRHHSLPCNSGPQTWPSSVLQSFGWEDFFVSVFLLVIYTAWN